MPNPYAGDPRITALHASLRPLKDNEIRLVTLHPAEDANETITCDLRIGPIDCEYQALSYTWDVEDHVVEEEENEEVDLEEDEEEGWSKYSRYGDGEGDEYVWFELLEEHKTSNVNVMTLVKMLKKRLIRFKTKTAPCPKKMSNLILVNDLEVPVMENLALALAWLRPFQRALTLWIDYLCIDQNNIEDRNAQVRRMDEIYSRAASVQIWLGAGNDSLYSACMGLFILGFRDTHLTEVYRDAVQADQFALFLRRIFQLRWFKRVWVVQEAVFANEEKSLIHLGGLSMPWRWFKGVVATILTHEDCCAQVVNTSPEYWHMNRWLFNMRHSMAPISYRPKDNGLVQLTRLCMWRQASDPRDQIFALLGILPENKRLVQADYSKTVGEVLTEATFLMIQTDGTLSPLGANCPTDLDPDRPSWVLDLSMLGKWYTLAHQMFSASDKSEAQVQRCQEKGLRMQGIQIGVIDTIISFQWRQHADQKEAFVGPSEAAEAAARIYTNRHKDLYTEEEATAKMKETICWGAPSSWYLKREFEEAPGIPTQTLFVTDSRTEWVGTAWGDLQRGDVVCIFKGGNMPFVARFGTAACDYCGCRRRGSLVSYAYVAGAKVMDGHLWNEAEEMQALDEFCIV